MEPGEKRMATERCAHLTAVAIANRLDEVWISLHPVLLILYVAQYFPTVYRRWVSLCVYMCVSRCHCHVLFLSDKCMLIGPEGNIAFSEHDLANS